MDDLVVGSSRIIFTNGLKVPVLAESEGRRQVVVITQPGAGLHADAVARSLRESGLSVEVVGVPDRDEAKSIVVASALYERFARMGLTRLDSIVAVGGGSVTDLAGFVAGTWMRGIDVVHVPTTLLAALDASIGGKTGINLGGKNSVGVFWEPSRVLIDFDILNQLPPMLLLEGMAEALKAGFVGDTSLVDVIDHKGLEAPLEEVVPGAVRVKAGFVERDPRDLSVRAMLNFGHTIGHAVEFASALSHGHAVGVGMIAAAAVSEAEVGFEQRNRLTDIVKRLGLNDDVGGLDRSHVEDLLGLDKKRDGGGLRMVLLREFGDPLLRSVDDRLVGIGLGAIGL